MPQTGLPIPRHPLPPWAVGRQNAQKFGYGQVGAVLRHQARAPRPAAAIAAIAGEIEDGQASGSLAQEDADGEHGLLLSWGVLLLRTGGARRLWQALPAVRQRGVWAARCLCHGRFGVSFLPPTSPARVRPQRGEVDVFVVVLSLFRAVEAISDAWFGSQQTCG